MTATSDPAVGILIRAAEIGGRQVDVRLSAGRILTIAERTQGHLCPFSGECVVDAQGGALLPGLHDHHIHLFALAAARDSIACGPPDVQCASGLVERLSAAAAASHGGWLRGIGYDEGVAGEIDRDWLDRVVPQQPVRIQHRTGRLWIMNSAALERLGNPSQSPLEQVRGRPSGRLYDGDRWLREQLRGNYPEVTATCASLAEYGITGLTDASVTNDRETFNQLCEQVNRGAILQSLNMMAGTSLADVGSSEGVALGAFKVHLHDDALPELEATSRLVSAAHEQGRGVAFHCVTEAELVFALAVLDTAGTLSSDRIEHAASVPPELIPEIARRGLAVVTQPHFVFERGDRYRQDIAAEEHCWLYRGACWLSAGVALGAGSDAPYGTANPWVAMQAAVDRRTRNGHSLGPDEALTPEQALDLYLAAADSPGRNPRRLKAGIAADLCLLDRPWSSARDHLQAVRVRATFRSGRCISRPVAADHASGAPVFSAPIPEKPMQ